MYQYKYLNLCITELNTTMSVIKFAYTGIETIKICFWGKTQDIIWTFGEN